MSSRRKSGELPPSTTPRPKRARGTSDAPAEAPAGDDSALVAEVPHGSRPEQVYSRLRELIVGGLLAPGSRIVETEIAGRLGVSRTPVREALQRLLQEGYVIDTLGAQQSRLTVAPLTRDDVHELLSVVGALEGLAAQRAGELAPAGRQALARTLRAANADFHEAGSATPVVHERLYDADERFHREIVEASAGPRLRALHAAVKPQAERYIRMYISMLTGDIGTSVAEHDTINDAIEQGRSDEAQRAIETNWRHAGSRLARVIELTGERGAW